MEVDMDSPESSLKLLAEKHGIIRSHLEQKENELAEKRMAIKIMKQQIQQSETNIFLNEQRLRTINENYVKSSSKQQELESRQSILTKELTDLDYKQFQYTTKLNKLQSNPVEQNQLVVDYKEKAKVNNLEFGKPKTTEEINLEQEINNLLSLKEKLDQEQQQSQSQRPMNTEEQEVDGDHVYINKVKSGELLHIIEAQKLAIIEAYNDELNESKNLEKLLGEKEGEIAKVKQSLQIQEKQNRARLLKMQRQLIDLQQTQQHLQNTAAYLDDQIDHGMK